jgi:hypothetical protein
MDVYTFHYEGKTVLIDLRVRVVAMLPTSEGIHVQLPQRTQLICVAVYSGTDSVHTQKFTVIVDETPEEALAIINRRGYTRRPE